MRNLHCFPEESSYPRCLGDPEVLEASKSSHGLVDTEISRSKQDKGAKCQQDGEGTSRQVGKDLEQSRWAFDRGEDHTGDRDMQLTLLLGRRALCSYPVLQGRGEHLPS